ncbi:MAG: hypothetical protein ABFS86_06730, partial [Planctomycetota bacterium]
RLPVRYRVPLLLAEVLELPAARVARLLGVETDEIETTLAGARTLFAREVRFGGGSDEDDRLRRFAGVVQPDAELLGAPPPPTEPAARSLPASKLALGLVVVLAGLGLLVLLSDGDAPVIEEDPVEIGAAPVPDEPETKPPSVPTQPETAEPKKAPGPVKPVRPTAVKPGVAMLLPSLLTAPSQIRLERVWAALEENPRQASAILTRLPNVTKEGHRIALLLALAGANGDSVVRDRLFGELRESGSAAVRRAAGAALGHVPGKDHAEVKATRTLSVRAGVIEDESLRTRLLEAAAAERDPAVLGTLIRVLGPSRARDRAIDERLYELARSPSAGLRQAAIDGLRAGNEGDNRVVGRLIEDPAIPAADRAKLVEAYARHEDPGETLGRLSGLIDRAEEPEIRAAAVRALRPLKTEGAHRKALAVLANAGNDRRVRLAALGVVAAEGSGESRRTLRGISEGDGDEAVRTAAKELLRTLSPEKDADGK